MAPEFAMQADISRTAIDILGAVAPILRALSADNVDPLAVIQLDAIGSRFPISGPLAKQIPDALTRSTSVRLGRLQNLVGWIPGDTPATLCQSAGGQAASLLTLCLVEMFCRNSAGNLLFELSMKVLPTDRCLAGMAQLSDLAEVVSNKLKPLAFGQHHANELTRIRQTYMNLGIELPPRTSESLLERLTIESMVELLDSMQQALQDSALLLHIEGFRGLGGVVSLLMALCPDDVILLVEGAPIFHGQRHNIIVSVKLDETTSFHLEKIIYGNKSSLHAVTFRPNEFLARPGAYSSYDHLTMETEGCLARTAEQILGVTTKSPQPVIASFSNLIGAIMLSFTGVDFGLGSDFPRDGFRSLLGPCSHARIRDKLTFLFEVSPSLDSFDLTGAYEEFCLSLSKYVPDTTCRCSHGCGSHIWASPNWNGNPCPLRSKWGGFQSLVGHAVLMCFVDTDLKTLPIIQRPKTSLGQHLCHSLLRRVGAHLDTELELQKPPDQNIYTIQQLHSDLCQLLGYIPSNSGEGHNVLGVSGGATSILPMTLGADSSITGHLVRYQALDGQFHDGRNYYKAITESSCIQPRALATLPIQQGNTIVPSAMGVHSDTIFSLRPHHNSLKLRATVKFGAQMKEISFYDTNLAYMATSLAHPCDHYPEDPVTLLDTASVIKTGVEAPAASDGRISVVLTHDNREAQFLAGVRGVPSVYQGISCIGCMISSAKEGRFQLLIQS
ncbi:hypothetical protein F4860DRAFT_522036 [Xylaria cubensis]|nr:hypothetical protein F4860DRAFT_522036 [Xylaria cubensis]